MNYGIDMHQTHSGFPLLSDVKRPAQAYLNAKQATGAWIVKEKQNGTCRKRKSVRFSIFEHRFRLVRIMVLIALERRSQPGSFRKPHAPDAQARVAVRRRTGQNGHFSRPHRVSRLPRYLLRLSSVLAVLAGQALACPTVDDVASGVRITFDDDTYSIYSRDSAGAVIEQQHDDGETFIFEASNGLLETGYIEDGVRDTFDYDFDTSNLFPLKPWSRMEGTQTVRDENGDLVENVGFQFHTLGESTYRIGDCSYAAMRVLTYYKFEDGNSMVELTYLKDLGIPVNTGFRADGIVDVYRAKSITAE